MIYNINENVKDIFRSVIYILKAFVTGNNQFVQTDIIDTIINNCLKYSCYFKSNE